MNVHSLALTTDLALARTRGTVTDRDDYLVVETPDDPGYCHGNFLVMPAPPQLGEVGFWSRRFADELGHKPGIDHIAFRWDGTTGDAGAVDELLAAGFAIEQVQLLTSTRLAAQEASLPIRALSPDEVLATADLAWTIGDRHDETFRGFLQRRAAWHRELVVRGIARFHGAFDADSLDPTALPSGSASGSACGALVASLGLVELGAVARYQDVQTHAAYRGRGLASALLVAAAEAARAPTLAIVAERGSIAARVYERVGFRAVESSASACRYPPGVSARPSRSRS